MQKMYRLPINLGRELRKLVQQRFVLAPVVPGAPVLGQLLQVGERHPSAPADARDLIGPAGACEAVVQIVNGGLWNGNRKRLDSHRSSPSIDLQKLGGV